MKHHYCHWISQAPAPAPAPAVALAPAVAPAPAPALAVTGPRVWCRQPPDWAGNSGGENMVYGANRIIRWVNRSFRKWISR